MSELVFFEDSSPISKKIKYEFKVPKYPPTTTDGSFYEPQATRIQNMKKSASSASQGLYDFYDDDVKGDTAAKYRDSVMNRLNNSEVALGRKPGFTTEEMMSVMNRTEERLLDSDKKEKENQKKKKESQADTIQTALEISKVLNNDNVSEE